MKNNGGFTMIEVLVAVAIFAIGFLAVGLMQIRAMNTTNSARRTTEAMALAEDQAEWLRSLVFYDKTRDLDGVHGIEPFDILPDLRAGEHPQAGDGYLPVANSPYTVRWRVTHNEPLPGYPIGVLDPAKIVMRSMTIHVWVTPNNNAGDTLAEIEFAKFCGKAI